MLNKESTVLDVGCRCGGLGLALYEEFGVTEYSGVDIHEAAVNEAKRMNSNAEFYCGDILKLTDTDLMGEEFSSVFSLSCVDWNVQFLEMLNAVWNHVKPGGYLVATFRLTDSKGCKDFDDSYQFINFQNRLEGERAAYVVMNANELLNILSEFDPSEINAYGYWGQPSATAVTPYDKLCFSAFSIKKSDNPRDSLVLNLDLPEDILASITDFS
jgi:trans-aconitate methyltransferase